MAKRGLTPTFIPIFFKKVNKYVDTRNVTSAVSSIPANSWVHSRIRGQLNTRMDLVFASLVMDWSAYQICKSKFCIRVRWLKIQLYWKVDFLSWSWSDPMVMWLLKMVKMDQMRQFFKRDKNLDVRRTNRFAFNRNKRHYLKDTCHFTIKPKFKWSISTNPIHFKRFYRIHSV